MLHPHRMGRRFAAVALALGLLATACGAGTVTDSTEAPSVPVVDRQAMVNQAIENLVRINGPYETASAEASVAEASLVPAWLIRINEPYETESDEQGAPDWLIDLNGPYTDEGAEEVPANAR